MNPRNEDFGKFPSLGGLSPASDTKLHRQDPSFENDPSSGPEA